MIHLLKSLLSFILGMFNIPGVIRNLVAQRELIRMLTWRDFMGRFKGSFGGIFWALIQPLFMMVIYTVVFSRFLGMRFGENDSMVNFSVYLLCGLLPWNAFAEGLVGSTVVVRGNVNLVKRVVFPLEVLPLNLTLVAMMQQLVGTLLLIPFAWIVSSRASVVIVVLPVIWFFQVLMFSGINFFWSSLSVMIPDLKQVTSMLLTGLIFLAPILYPIDIVPEQYRFLIELNPITHLVLLYRQVILSGDWPNMRDMIEFAVFSIVIFLAGYTWYQRTKRNLIDFL
jgi:lipopolysaccharide transport system permease protein